MDRQAELLVLITKLKKDLCAKLSFIGSQFKSINADNVKSFKEYYNQFTQIRNDLEMYLNEYNEIKK